MDFKDIISKNRIKFGIKANDKDEIIEELAKLFLNDNIVNEKDLDILIHDIKEREKLSSTGMQDGIAIPHTKSKAVNKIALAVAIDKDGKDFNSMDEEPSTLFFMIVAPENTGQEHLEILRKISKLTFKEELLEEMVNTLDADKVIEVLLTL